MSDSCSVLSDSVQPYGLACQAPLSMEFSRKEYWSGLPFPSPEDLPDPGIKRMSLALQADSLPSEPPGKPTIKRHFCVLDFSKYKGCYGLCLYFPVTYSKEQPFNGSVFIPSKRCLQLFTFLMSRTSGDSGLVPNQHLVA